MNNIRRATESAIPEFKSIQEEAVFWDTHDTSEFEDEFEPVDLQVSPELRSRLERRSRDKQSRRVVHHN